jgi:hypothetical protein
MKTIDFFKEYIIPTINEAKDAGIGWQGLVKAAKTYGVNIDQLKGLLDQKKFAAYLATAAATPTAAPTPNPRPSVSVQKSDVAPIPGAVKLSDGKWYVRDASGKVVPVLRSGA